MENTLVSLIPLHELEERFAYIVEEKLKSYFSDASASQTKPEKEFLTRKEVSEKLRISLPTLNSLTKEGIVTGYRIGGRVLYKWDEVESVLTEITSTKYKRKDLSKK